MGSAHAQDFVRLPVFKSIFHLIPVVEVLQLLSKKEASTVLHVDFSYVPVVFKFGAVFYLMPTHTHGALTSVDCIPRTEGIWVVSILELMS